MKIEFLESGASECPLVRLFDFDRMQGEQLMSLVAALAAGTQTEVDLSSFCTPIHNCTLVLVQSNYNRGIVSGTDHQFTCELSRDRWDEIAQLIAPLAESVHGFNWLDNTSDIPLLLSVDGCW